MVVQTVRHRNHKCVLCICAEHKIPSVHFAHVHCTMIGKGNGIADTTVFSVVFFFCRNMQMNRHEANNRRSNNTAPNKFYRNGSDLFWLYGRIFIVHTTAESVSFLSIRIMLRQIMLSLCLCSISSSFSSVQYQLDIFVWKIITNTSEQTVLVRRIGVYVFRLGSRRHHFIVLRILQRHGHKSTKELISFLFQWRTHQ